MKERLGIAIALAGHPDILILDEPINGLDPEAIVEMRELIIRLNREMHMTIIVSSHILDELSRLATHYGFIDHGHMVKEISAEELEAACAKKIRVKVSDMTAFSKALEHRKAEYRIVSDSEADIYSEITVSELVEAADSYDCQILTMKEQDESLESFYLNLIGGADHV